MTLGNAIARYVGFNQSVGMRFQVDAALLKAFHRHAGEVDLAAISRDVVVAFLQPRRQVTSTWFMKHRALRRFYQYGITRGLVARSPVPTAVPRLTETFVPHIYSDEELRRLLAGVETHQARARCTIAAPTFRALLLLLYGAGLRLGEALALRREEVDLRTGMILIRAAKFYKARSLPIGPKLTQALAESLAPTPHGPSRAGPADVFREPIGRRPPASDRATHLRLSVRTDGRLCARGIPGGTEAARLPAYLCRASAPGVVPRRGRRPAVLAASVDLPRTHADRVYPALSHDDPRTPRTGEPTLRDLRPRGGRS